jgi:hypothetical protein
MEVSVRERGESGKHGRLGWRERGSAVLEDFIAECGKVHQGHDGDVCGNTGFQHRARLNGSLFVDSQQAHAVMRGSADVPWRARDEGFRCRSRIDVQRQCVYHVSDLGWEAGEAVFWSIAVFLDAHGAIAVHPCRPNRVPDSLALDSRFHRSHQSIFVYSVSVRTRHSRDEGRSEVGVRGQLSRRYDM